MVNLASALRRAFSPARDSVHPSVRRVLVVDDEESIRKFVVRVLGEAGFETAAASNGNDALAMAETTDFDLVLTDLMMPNMNGDELARRLRQTAPDLPVLYLTGFSDRLFAERMLLWDHEAFLDKPCTIQGLLEAVSLAVSGHTVLQAAGQ